MKVRLVLTLLRYRLPYFSYVNDVVVVIISKNLHKKGNEVSIKTKSTPASLSLTGQVTKHTTVKWTIIAKNGEKLEFPRFGKTTLRNVRMI